MCGIFGILVSVSAEHPAEHRLRETTSALSHRGPDHAGVHRGAGFGFAHTRLTLVDLSPRSNQPFLDHTGRYCLVYNGEVYNHRALRCELEADGVTFRTTSDTEVLLELFIRDGVAATLPRLEGMFAFGFYDSSSGALTLGRDRFGIKPLYYHQSTEAFCFSSEVVGLEPWIRLEPDVLSIGAYLQGNATFVGPTTRTSFFKGVRMLAPGWTLTVTHGGEPALAPFATARDLWDPEYARELDGMPDAHLVDLVDEGLHRAVESQLDSDAPVGLYCSGGVDSSLIAAIASRYRPNVRLFHANVVGKLSEFPAATQVAEHLGLQLDAVAVRDADFIERIPQTIRHYEYPFTGRPHSIAFLMVSELVRDHGVKGVLSGEGSDECYYGYRKTIPRLNEVMAALPGRIAGRVSASWRKLRGRPLPLRRMLESSPWVTRVGRGQVSRELLNRFDRQIELQEVHDLLTGLKEGDADPRNLQVLPLLNYHLRTLLHRNDRLGMAASVEARFPFLDTRVVRIAVNLPYRCRVRLTRSLSDRSNPFVTGKWIVRKVADRYLPRELSAMRKKGFKVNAAKRMSFAPECFRGTFAADLLGLSSHELRFLMDQAPDALKVKMMHLNVWADVFLNKDSDEQILSKLHQTVIVAEKKRRKRGRGNADAHADVPSAGLG